MTMFGMPPSDPEGLRPGVDEAIGVGDEGEILDESEDNRADAVLDSEDPPNPREQG